MKIPRIKVDKTFFFGSTNLSEYIKNDKRAKVGSIALKSKNILSVIYNIFCLIKDLNKSSKKNKVRIWEIIPAKIK